MVLCLLNRFKKVEKVAKIDQYGKGFLGFFEMTYPNFLLHFGHFFNLLKTVQKKPKSSLWNVTFTWLY